MLDSIHASEELAEKRDAIAYGADGRFKRKHDTEISRVLLNAFYKAVKSSRPWAVIKEEDPPCTECGRMFSVMQLFSRKGEAERLADGYNFASEKRRYFVLRTQQPYQEPRENDTA